jgi:sulfite exporter TauE/SafE
MDTDLFILVLAAASIGFFHTILGPDHYIPFILLSRSRGWSFSKTILITLGCAVGHVGSSVLIGLLGIGLGWNLNKITLFESSRGNIAAWLLILFGGLYMVYGLFKAMKNKPHTHWHSHISGMVHKHPHHHSGEHAHIHERASAGSLTPWILFLIFVFGPCEPLIPLLIYPAAQQSMSGMYLVIIVFSVTTAATMLGIVLISSYGLKYLTMGRFEKYTHLIAGTFIFLSGIGVQFLGL